MQSRGARAFEISSSYGLAGWVIAESYRFEGVPNQGDVYTGQK
jgi:hypothetical protein